jgi:hypothetical protein
MLWKKNYPYAKVNHTLFRALGIKRVRGKGGREGGSIFYFTSEHINITYLTSNHILNISLFFLALSFFFSL